MDRIASKHAAEAVATSQGHWADADGGKKRGRSNPRVSLATAELGLFLHGECLPVYRMDQRNDCHLTSRRIPMALSTTH